MKLHKRRNSACNTTDQLDNESLARSEYHRMPKLRCGDDEVEIGREHHGINTYNGRPQGTPRYDKDQNERKWRKLKILYRE